MNLKIKFILIFWELGDRGSSDPNIVSTYE
jgi:hypothetical protein